MKRGILMSAAMAVVIASLAPVASGWETQLNLRELWGQGGQHYITGGVPLLPGQAKEVGDLAVIVRDAKGEHAMPAQFRVLARYWRGDNSIRWVLVDLQGNFGGFEDKVVYLVPAANGKPTGTQPAELKTTLVVADDADKIVVNTGPAVFTINKKKFAFLDSAVIDGVEMLATTADMGNVMEDTLGNKYFGSEGTGKVYVVESGPLRVQVRAIGRNMPRDGKGYSKGMYGYDYMMNFYAGSTDVNVDLVLTNNPAQSIGEPTFRDASLMMKLANGGKGYRLHGMAPIDGALGAGESVCLHQDSNGADTWQRCQGDFSSTKTVSFRGYKVLKRVDGKDEVIGQGDQARGVAHLFNDKGGLIVLPRNFWQQFPKAVEVGADGMFRLAMWPREAPVPQYLEDAGGKGHEVVLHFYTIKGKKLYAADEGGKTWPHVFADCWDSRVLPRPTLEHIAATGALTDVGPSAVPVAGMEDYALEVNERRMLMTDKYWGNGFGWNVFGSRWQAHGGHSMRGARQPIKEDHFLYSYYYTGGRGWLEAGNNRSRHFRDVRCYRIDDQDPFGFPDRKSFAAANRQEDYCNRPQPKDAEYQKYTQGRWPRSTWWLPNPAHITMDLVYDRYLLFGDQRAFENLPVIAANGGTQIAERAYVHRETGWGFRAIDRYYELTGDPKAKALLDKAIKTHSSQIGKTPLVCAGEAADGGVNWWFTQVYSRGVSMTALHTGDPTALELCKTLAVGKESRAEYFCTLFAVLYHLTGDQKYKDAVMSKTNDGKKLLVTYTDGDFPATAAWLLNQPPLKK